MPFMSTLVTGFTVLRNNYITFSLPVLLLSVAPPAVGSDATICGAVAFAHRLHSS